MPPMTCSRGSETSSVAPERFLSLGRNVRRFVFPETSARIRHLRVTGFKPFCISDLSVEPRAYQQACPQLLGITRKSLRDWHRAEISRNAWCKSDRFQTAFIYQRLKKITSLLSTGPSTDCVHNFAR